MVEKAVQTVTDTTMATAAMATPADMDIEKTAVKPASDAPGKQRSFWQLLGALFAALWRALAGVFIALWHRLKRPSLPWLYRVNVVSRALAGCVGGYYLAASSAGLNLMLHCAYRARSSLE